MSVVIFLVTGEVIFASGPKAPDDSTRTWHGVSLRTNLLWDAAAQPNLAIQIPLGEHVTLGVAGGLKSWPRWLVWDNDVNNPRHWRNFAIVPEFRFYFHQVYDGWFAGVDALYTHYNVGQAKFPFGLYPAANEYRLQGDVLGLGLTAGHSWWLGQHWRLEVEAGAAVGYNSAERFECAHCGTKLGDDRGVVIIPKLGVNMAYNFKRREQKKQEILQILRPTPPPAVEEPQPFHPQVPVVQDWMGVAGELAPQHPVLRPSSEYKPYSPDRILRKEEGALYVFYELNNAQLKESFTEGGATRDNGPVLEEILQVTASILRDTTSSVSCIQIVGLASIEGAEDLNRRLSQERAMALQQYIQQRINVPTELFETVGGGEAWADFRDVVQDLIQAGGGEGLTPAQLREVLRIVDGETNVWLRESKIKELEGGAVYQALLPHVLSGLRNSGYIRIYFDHVPDGNARTINEAIGTLEAGEPQRALSLLEGVRADARSSQARAAALLALGRESEAEEVLGEAASRGDEACRALLEDWKAWKDRRKAYEQYLNEMKEYNK